MSRDAKFCVKSDFSGLNPDDEGLTRFWLDLLYKIQIYFKKAI